MPTSRHASLSSGSAIPVLIGADMGMDRAFFVPRSRVFRAVGFAATWFIVCALLYRGPDLGWRIADLLVIGCVMAFLQWATRSLLSRLYALRERQLKQRYGPHGEMPL